MGITERNYNVHTQEESIQPTNHQLQCIENVAKRRKGRKGSVSSKVYAKSTTRRATVAGERSKVKSAAPSVTDHTSLGRYIDAKKEHWALVP